MEGQLEGGERLLLLARQTRLAVFMVPMMVVLVVLMVLVVTRTALAGSVFAPAAPAADHAAAAAAVVAGANVPWSGEVGTGRWRAKLGVPTSGTSALDETCRSIFGRVGALERLEHG